MRSLLSFGFSTLMLILSPFVVQAQDQVAFIPDVTIPDDGNHYIVIQASTDFHVRPQRSSPVIGNIFPYDNPRVVQVYSSLEYSEGFYWWEVRRGGQVSYISTIDADHIRPYIATDLPPNLDMLGGYEGDTLLVTGIFPSDPNSAGGVDASIGIINPEGSDTIKYVRYNISPYNAVGDRVSGRTRNSDSVRLRLTGPIRGDGSEHWSTWENVLYNKTIKCIVINAVEITYMDDSTDNFTGNDLTKILHSDTNNDCSYID